MTSAAADLRRLADLPERDGLGWYASAIRRYLSGEVRSLDAAFALKAGPGERSFHTVEALAQRDEAIRELRRRHHADQGRTVAAKAIANDLTRYECAGWRNDRMADAMPAAYRGKPRGLHWLILKAGGTAPGWRRICDLIGDCNELPDLVATDP